MEGCLNIHLVITGGSEGAPYHTDPGAYPDGMAIDLGFNSNPGLKNNPRIPCCAMKCLFKYMENNGRNYHLQTREGINGGRGLLPPEDFCSVCS